VFAKKEASRARKKAARAKAEESPNSIPKWEINKLNK
jgi:hypothetical protein